jgi:hypothetical protein
VEVFEMRLDAQTGLLYTNSDVTRGRARDLAWTAPPESEPSNAGRRVRRSQQQQPPQLLPTSAVTSSQINAGAWPAFRSKPGFPWSAVGFLQLYRGANNEYFGTCSASMYGPRVIVTAAHCLYNRDTKVFTKAGLFSPGHYIDATGKAVKPYSSYSIKNFNWMTGWVTETNSARAWW